MRPHAPYTFIYFATSLQKNQASLRVTPRNLSRTLLYDNLLFMVRNGGLLAAVDATNGKLLYRERLNAPGQYSASPVAANDHIYLSSNRGVITIVKVNKEFKITHQHDLKDPVFVTPAIDKNTLYIRTEKALLAFRTND